MRTTYHPVDERGPVKNPRAGPGQGDGRDKISPNGAPPRQVFASANRKPNSRVYCRKEDLALGSRAGNKWQRGDVRECAALLLAPGQPSECSTSGAWGAHS
jgi:hypothetical protein